MSDLSNFARTVNDLDDRLPKSRGDCFDIGTWGGCGVSCPLFIAGDCTEPQEISKLETIREHGIAGAISIREKYECFRVTIGDNFN